MKDRALRHLLLAAGRSVGDHGHADAVAAVCDTLEVTRVARGRFTVSWLGADGASRSLDLDGSRFHLYARGDVASHVERRAATIDHRGHNWAEAHEVWTEILGLPIGSLVPTRRTFAPRPLATHHLGTAPGSDADGRRAAAVGGVLGAALAAAVVGELPSRRVLAGASGVVLASRLTPPAPTAQAAARVDSPRAVGALAGAMLAAAAPPWAAAAACLVASDVAATALRREPPRARALLGAAVTAAGAGAALRLAGTPLGGAAPVGPRSNVARSRALGVGAAAALVTTTVVQAPLGTRDRLVGWLLPAALGAAASGADATGERGAPIVSAAALGAELGRMWATRSNRRRRAADGVPPAASVAHPETDRSDLGSVVVPFPTRRSA